MNDPLKAQKLQHEADSLMFILAAEREAGILSPEIIEKIRLAAIEAEDEATAAWKVWAADQPMRVV
jgi:hypothetical protein